LGYNGTWAAPEGKEGAAAPRTFVLTTHYDVSRTSRLAKIFNRLPFLLKYLELVFQLQVVKISRKLIVI